MTFNQPEADDEQRPPDWRPDPQPGTWSLRAVRAWWRRTSPYHPWLFDLGCAFWAGVLTGIIVLLLSGCEDTGLSTFQQTQEQLTTMCRRDTATTTYRCTADSVQRDLTFRAMRAAEDAQAMSAAAMGVAAGNAAAGAAARR